MQNPTGELVIQFAFYNDKMQFDSKFNGAGMFSYGAPTPVSALLTGRGVQLRFPSVQEQISQDGANILGGIGLKLQEELPSYFANVDWERLKSGGDYGESIRRFILNEFVQWIRDNILTRDPIVCISFFSVK
jgi:hypothetical protein